MKRAGNLLRVGENVGRAALVALIATSATSRSIADPVPAADEYADVAGNAAAFGDGAILAADEAQYDAPAEDSRYALIFSNSGDPNDPFLVTRPGAGCSGRDVSDVQTALGLQAYGFNCMSSAPNAVADDFVVPAGQTWTINEIVFYLFQTSAPGTTVTSVLLRVQPENPLGGSVPALTAYTPTTTFTNVYKNLDTDAPGTVCNRRVQQCVVGPATPYVLGAGTYYLIWEATGSDSYSGPWQPPVVIPGATNKPGANGMSAMHTTGIFQPALDPGSSHAPQDFVFVLQGSIASTWAPGDLNCDGLVTFDDIDPFVLALTGYDPYHDQYPNCDWMLADCNGDGAVNFDDIDAFVALLAPPGA
jgi:hypothetical protein